MPSVRRKDREISSREAVALLDCAEYGILSTADRDGQPYGVPMSYAYQNGCIFFHCALAGHKLDNLAANPNVSFCVVGKRRFCPTNLQPSTKASWRLAWLRRCSAKNATLRWFCCWKSTAEISSQRANATSRQRIRSREFLKSKSAASAARPDGDFGDCGSLAGENYSSGGLRYFSALPSRP